MLIKRLEGDGFVTADRGFEHEHNLKSLSFGIVVIHVARNKIAFYRPLFAQLLEAIATVKAGQAVHVSALAGGSMTPPRRSASVVRGQLSSDSATS